MLFLDLPCLFIGCVFFTKKENYSEWISHTQKERSENRRTRVRSKKHETSRQDRSVMECFTLIGRYLSALICIKSIHASTLVERCCDGRGYVQIRWIAAWLTRGDIFGSCDVILSGILDGGFCWGQSALECRPVLGIPYTQITWRVVTIIITPRRQASDRRQGRSLKLPDRLKLLQTYSTWVTQHQLGVATNHPMI